MKQIAAILTFGLLLIGCNQDMTNVFAPSEPKPVANQCKASCVISDITPWDVIIAPEDTAMIIGLIGDTLRTYYYRLEDGREGILDKEDYDTLSVGDVFEKCSVVEAVGACPVY